MTRSERAARDTLKLRGYECRKRLTIAGTHYAIWISGECVTSPGIRPATPNQAWLDLISNGVRR